MNNCYFCHSIMHQRSALSLIDQFETDLFVVSWDINPATPGHAIIITKRHAPYMKDLGSEERRGLIDLVTSVKEHIQHTDLIGVYEHMLTKTGGTISEKFIRSAMVRLKTVASPPQAFNDGINDGPAAGQTVPHFHWHVMPRWKGDIPNPRGGIRHMFPEMGNYDRHP